MDEKSFYVNTKMVSQNSRRKAAAVGGCGDVLSVISSVLRQGCPTRSQVTPATQDIKENEMTQLEVNFYNVVMETMLRIAEAEEERSRTEKQRLEVEEKLLELLQKSQRTKEYDKFKF